LGLAQHFSLSLLFVNKIQPTITNDEEKSNNQQFTFVQEFLAWWNIIILLKIIMDVILIFWMRESDFSIFGFCNNIFSVVIDVGGKRWGIIILLLIPRKFLDSSCIFLTSHTIYILPQRGKKVHVIYTLAYYC